MLRAPWRCVAVAVAVAVALLGAGCSGGDGDDEPAPPPMTSSSAAPALPLPVLDDPVSAPLTAEREPVWSSPSAVNPQIAVVDDVAVFTGTVGPYSGDDAVVAADLRTGRELWRLRQGVVPGTGTVQVEGLFEQTDEVVTAPTGDGAVVLLPYRDDGCEYGCSTEGDPHPVGVLAVDVRTGEAVWGHALVDAADPLPDRLRSGTDTVAVTAASSQVVVVEAGSRLVVDRPFDDADERTLPVSAVGLDPTTGRRLWVRGGTHPLDVVGDVVLAIEHRARTRLLGLDARTGQVRWRGSEVLDHDEAVGGVLLDSVSPDLVAVGVSISRPRLVDPATGRDLPEQLTDSARYCGAWRGGPVQLACEWLDPATSETRLLTVDEAGRQSLSAATITSSPAVTTAGVIGMVDQLTDRGRVLDPAGSPAGRIGPGRLVVVEGRWIVVDRGDPDRSRLVVLRRR